MRDPPTTNFLAAPRPRRTVRHGCDPDRPPALGPPHDRARRRAPLRPPRSERAGLPRWLPELRVVGARYHPLPRGRRAHGDADGRAAPARAGQPARRRGARARPAGPRARPPVRSARGRCRRHHVEARRDGAPARPFARRDDRSVPSRLGGRTALQRRPVHACPLPRGRPSLRYARALAARGVSRARPGRSARDGGLRDRAVAARCVAARGLRRRVRRVERAARERDHARRLRGAAARHRLRRHRAPAGRRAAVPRLLAGAAPARAAPRGPPDPRPARRRRWCRAQLRPGPALRAGLGRVRPGLGAQALSQVAPPGAIIVVARATFATRADASRASLVATSEAPSSPPSFSPRSRRAIAAWSAIPAVSNARTASPSNATTRSSSLRRAATPARISVASALAHAISSLSIAAA